MGGAIGDREEWTGLVFLTASMPVLTRTTLEFGLEQMLFSDSWSTRTSRRRVDRTTSATD